MPTDEKLICCCFVCQGEIRFPARAVGKRIECPHCHKETMLYDPNDEGEPNSNSKTVSQPSDSKRTSQLNTSPSLVCCKTCNGPIAESAQICIHCGQNWPAINLVCPQCGANDFDFEVYEDNSSVWVTPSIIGVLSAAIWEGMRSKPQQCVRCLNCGYLAKLSPE